MNNDQAELICKMCTLIGIISIVTFSCDNDQINTVTIYSTSLSSQTITNKFLINGKPQENSQTISDIKIWDTSVNRVFLYTNLENSLVILYDPCDLC